LPRAAPDREMVSSAWRRAERKLRTQEAQKIDTAA
jgi:hypothetical protein